MPSFLPQRERWPQFISWRASLRELVCSCLKAGGALFVGQPVRAAGGGVAVSVVWARDTGTAPPPPPAPPFGLSLQVRNRH